MQLTYILCVSVLNQNKPSNIHIELLNKEVIILLEWNKPNEQYVFYTKYKYTYIKCTKSFFTELLLNHNLSLGFRSTLIKVL